MALTNAQTLSVQLEYVRPGLPVLFERSDTTLAMIEKRPAEMVSTRTARVPLTTNPGGNSGAATFVGDDLGRGSSTEYDHALVTPVGMKFAVEIQKLAEYGTNSATKAIANVAKKAVVDAMKTFRKDIDTWLQTAGNGKVGTVSSGSTTATLVLANTPFGARLMRKNLQLSVYTSNLATKRGEVIIDAAPIRGLGKTQTIHVADVDAGTIAAMSDGDVLLVSGLSGASPTWLYGIPYQHNTSTSGSWQGIAKSNDYAVANGVNANSAGFSLAPFRLAINQIRQELGADSLGSLMWHTHDAAVAGYEEYGLSLSTLERTSAQALPDLLFDAKKGFSIGGFPVKTSNHADPTRFDLMNLETWGKVEWLPIDYFEIGGETVFEIRGASGGVAAAYIFYLVAGMQFFVDNPKGLSGVNTLSLPTGY